MIVTNLNHIQGAPVVPMNKSAIEKTIKGVNYSEVEKIVETLDVYDLDNLYAKQVVKVVRIYVTKLLKRLESRESYLVPLVEGLKNTTDDYTFITSVYLLKDVLWY